MIKVKKIFNILLTVLLTIAILYGLTEITEKKSSDIKYKSFFNQKEDFNVLFYGSSHVINGIYPMELWNDYGIVSYNFGGHANAIATDYWVMINSLDYTKPKVVVIDCFGLSSPCKTSDIYSYVHLSLDAFPLSLNKIKTVFDLTNDPEMSALINDGKTRETNKRTKLELLWTFSIYHSRWYRLNENDFNVSYNKEKGAESRIGITKKYYDINDTNEINNDETTSSIYLKKIINYLKSNGIEPLLIYLPCDSSEGCQIEANTMVKIAKDNNVNYINFLNEDIINNYTDFYDDEGHLNPSGARKVTDFLGKYLVNNYNVEDQRKNVNYSNWNSDYDEYVKMKIENYSNQNKLEEYLMLMYDKNFDYIIETDNAILYDERYLELFKNIGIDYNVLTEDINEIRICGNEKIEYVNNNSNYKGINIKIKKHNSEEILNTKYFENSY